METEINIVEILKDKPQGTKLYSSACGKCKLEEVDDKSFKISFYNSKFGFMNGGEGHLDKKYIILGFDNFDGCISTFTPRVCTYVKIYNSYRFAKLKYLKIIKS